MNSVLISGTIAKEVKPNKTNKVGVAVLAVKRPFPYNRDANGESITDFLTLKLIGEKSVLSAAKWWAKGTPLIVEGVICRDTWKTEEGRWDEYNYLIVKSWEFQIAKKDGSNVELESEFLPEKTDYEPPKSPDDEEFMNVPSNIGDDLPFRK